VEEDAAFCLMKDGTFFPLSLSNEPGIRLLGCSFDNACKRIRRFSFIGDFRRYRHLPFIQQQQKTAYHILSIIVVKKCGLTFRVQELYIQYICGRDLAVIFIVLYIKCAQLHYASRIPPKLISTFDEIISRNYRTGNRSFGFDFDCQNRNSDKAIKIEM
jgi:hypothetical protein